MTQGGKEVKISFESFLHKEIQDALYWNKAIGSKIMFGSKTGKYFCKECNFWDNQKANIVNHVELKHLTGFPGYTCVLCHYVFQTWFIFKSHVKKNHCSDAAETRKSLQLLNCRNSYRNSKVPQTHIQKTLQKELKKSSQSLRESNKKDISRKDFQPKHTKPKSLKKEVVSFYACGKCDSKYTQKSQLYLHYKVVHNISPVVDEISFEVPVYDENRQQIIAKDSQPILIPESSLGVSQNPKRVKTETPCTYCPENFTAFAEYAEHEATHAGVYMYNCHLCKGLGFRIEQTFIEHMKTKHKMGISWELVKMIPCSFTHTCQRKFLSKQIMNAHISNDHLTKKTEKTLDEAGSNQPLQNANKSLIFNPSKQKEDYPINFSISLPTIPIPQEDLNKVDRFKISSTLSQNDFGSIAVNETPSAEISSSESLIQPSSELCFPPKLDQKNSINQTETLLESSCVAQDINTPASFPSDEQYCDSYSSNHFELSDPLAMEPGELVDTETDKLETFLEETVVMC